MKGSTKRHLIVYIMLLMVYLIICSNFLRLHYAQDTYSLIENGYQVYAKHFLVSGRLISASYLYLSSFLNLSIETNLRISYFLGVIFMSTAVFVLYYSIKSRMEKLPFFKEIFLLFASSLVVYQFCSIELLLFAESASMAFAMLMLVLSATLFTSKKKYHYLFSFFTVILAGIGYQGVLSLFVPLVFVLLLLDKERNFKKTFIKLFTSGVFYAVSYLIVLLMIKFFSNYFNIIGREVFVPNLLYIIKTYLHYGKILLIDGIYVLPKYWYSIVLVIVSLILCLSYYKNRKWYIGIWNVAFLIGMCIFFSIFPLISMKEGTQYVEPRIVISYGSCFGLLFLYWLINSKISSKIFTSIMTSIMFIVFISNAIYYVYGSSQMLLTNAIDEIEANLIIKEVERYENLNNTRVENIVILFDKNPCYYAKNVSHFKGLTYRSLAQNWAVPGVLIQYTGRKFNWISTKEEDKLLFMGQDEGYFNPSTQLKMVGNTLYYLVY